MKVQQNGFTLIELAVVIAIVAILAAVAIPRFGNATAQAERATIIHMSAQLNSAVALYTADQAKYPKNFKDFVSIKPAPIPPRVITVKPFGKGTCAVNNKRITGCTFQKYRNVQYRFNTDGSITVSGKPCCGNKTPL